MIDLKDVIWRIREKFPVDHAELLDLADRIEALTAEVQAWRECALYDATMEGPVFKGWDRSALERCRRAALTGDDT